jgi:regulator of cell morphogenesis and NO signaling
MLVQETTKLVDVIHQQYLILPILNRFNIQLGFGNKTVKEICAEQEVNMQFFLEIVNSFLDEDYFPQSELQTFPLKHIINYIKKSHIFYVDFKVPQIEGMISDLLHKASVENKRSYELIQKFFLEYKAELIVHIEKEEKAVHPYVLKIDEAFQNNQITDEIKQLVKKEPISLYASEHDNIEDKLYDLKNLMIKYLPPAKDYALSNAILYELFRLERDLSDHSRIEEKVLIPKIEGIEKQILGGGK